MLKKQEKVVSISPIITGAIGTVPKCLGKKTRRNWNERKNRNHQLVYWKKPEKPGETCCHWDSWERPPSNNNTNNHQIWGARGVVGIIAGNGHGDTSSNPGRDWLHFT